MSRGKIKKCSVREICSDGLLWNLIQSREAVQRIVEPATSQAGHGSSYSLRRANNLCFCEPDYEVWFFAILWLSPAPEVKGRYANVGHPAIELRYDCGLCPWISDGITGVNCS